MCSIFLAAEHRVRGLLMFELHAALSELGRRESERGRLDSMNLRDTLLVSPKYNKSLHKINIDCRGAI